MSSGKLYLDKTYAHESVPTDFAEKIESAFADSYQKGLLLLGLDSSFETPQQGIPESFSFWQRFSRHFITQIYLLSEIDTTALPPLPTIKQEELVAYCSEVPFFTGFEYVNEELLKQLWQDLYRALEEELLKHAGKLKDFLHTYNPAWSLVGRICFHLAENKNNVKAPFAFLATYTTTLGENKAVKHLPLGQALKEYAGEQNKATLLALLLPIQKAAEKSKFVANLINSREIFQAQMWSARQAHHFLQEIQLFESAGIVVRVPNWWNSQKPPQAKVQVSFEETRESLVGLQEMLDFDIGVHVPGGEKLTQAELTEILHSKESLIKVKGNWVEIDTEKLHTVLDHWSKIQQSVKNQGISFAEAVRLLSGMPSTIAGVEPLPEQEAQWMSVVAGGRFEEILNNLRKPSALMTHGEHVVLERYLQAKLRPYQEQGVQWLFFLYKLKLGGCLADDMGLGKTIQIIALLTLIKYQSEMAKPHLLIVPASLLGNWQAEIERFAPSLTVKYVHPSMSIDVQNITPQHFKSIDLVITTYGLIYRLETLRHMSWDIIILDEAQTIKNSLSKQTRAVKGLKGAVHFALTGTPIENNLGDLWSLFDFFASGLLGSLKTFNEYVKKSTSSEDTEKKLRFYASLRNLIAPYILRRLKSDKRIIADLPDKTEIIAFCGLTPTQIALYQQAVDELTHKLEELDGQERRGLIFHYLMRFKQICNHPAQWLGYGNYLPEESGKFLRIKEICEDIIAKQEKVLIFTQFQEIIPALSAYLTTLFRREGLLLHGGTSIKQRAALVKEFSQEQGPPFFILSVKAGGTGLNLTQAAHVIHFDRWWNPAVENQATDRAYRIGQKRNVMVYKFVSRGTLEEKIDKLITEKKELSAEILGIDSEISLTTLRNDQILDLVKLDLNKICEDL
jgi:SNF2 family DNA or RNA helicase